MIIYKVTNKLNGKMYVGQTVQRLSDRWRDHVRGDNGKNTQSYLFRAVQKYGHENFIVEEIDSSKTVEGLNLLEEYYIKKFNTLAPNGYNLLPGGGNRRQHEDTKKRLSEMNKGKSIPNRWNGGNTQSPSEETRTKISEKLKGRPIERRWTGGNKKPRTEEQKAHLSKLNKGKANTALYKPIIAVETETRYESVNAAAKALNINRTIISALLKSGRQHKKTGLSFKFV